LDPTNKYRGVPRVQTTTTHADATTTTTIPTTRDEKNIEEGPTPYSLSPFRKPWKDSIVRDVSDGEEEIGANIDRTLDEIDGSLSETPHSSGGDSQFWKWLPPMARVSGSLPQITLSIRSQLKFATDWIVTSPIVPANWVTNAPNREDGSDKEGRDEEEDDLYGRYHDIWKSRKEKFENVGDVDALLSFFSTHGYSFAVRFGIQYPDTRHSRRSYFHQLDPRWQSISTTNY
jgi:hypothetical protein